MVASVLFVLDVSSRQGTGHLYRCAALAEGLARFRVRSTIAFRGEQVYADKPGPAERFVCIPIAGGSEEQEISQLDRIAGRLGVDALVIDHYRATPAYQHLLASIGAPWMQFDNGACFRIQALWIVNINPLAEPDMYRNFASEDSRLLLGPRYAVLRPEFAAARDVYSPAQTASQALVFLGGGDVRRPLQHVLSLLLPNFPGIAFHVVGSTTSITELKRFQGYGNFVWLGELPTLARPLASVDLAIVSAGTSSYECACVGVPFVTVEVADNQAPIAAAWATLGVAPRLGRWDQVDRGTLVSVLESLISGPARRRQSELSRTLVDGRGVERLTGSIVDGA